MSLPAVIMAAVIAGGAGDFKCLANLSVKDRRQLSSSVAFLYIQH